MTIFIGAVALVTVWVVCGLAFAVWHHHAVKGHHASPLDKPRNRGHGHTP